MHLCIDCIHHVIAESGVQFGNGVSATLIDEPTHVCRRNRVEKISPVDGELYWTGKVLNCESERNHGGCNQFGNNFTQK